MNWHLFTSFLYNQVTDIYFDCICNWPASSLVKSLFLLSWWASYILKPPHHFKQVHSEWLRLLCTQIRTELSLQWTGASDTVTTKAVVIIQGLLTFFLFEFPLEWCILFNLLFDQDERGKVIIKIFAGLVLDMLHQSNTLWEEYFRYYIPFVSCLFFIQDI